MASPTLDELKSIYGGFGVHEHGYLEFSYNRYAITKSLALADVRSKLRILDIGAHWLHNSLFYAAEGHHVIGADLFLEETEFGFITRLAQDRGIDLVRYQDLSSPRELGAIAESSIDMVLFTEIIEHITFNPVRFWEAIYRVLKPGGRIVITTPNYHYPPHFLREAGRILRGYSSGIGVREILDIQTFGHHWKIFSCRDLARYCECLSPDFRFAKDAFFNSQIPGNRAKSWLSGAMSLVPAWRQNLYCEWVLEAKKKGITAKPHW